MEVPENIASEIVDVACRSDASNESRRVLPVCVFWHTRNVGVTIDFVIGRAFVKTKRFGQMLRVLARQAIQIKDTKVNTKKSVRLSGFPVGEAVRHHPLSAEPHAEADALQFAEFICSPW